MKPSILFNRYLFPLLGLAIILTLFVSFRIGLPHELRFFVLGLGVIYYPGVVLNVLFGQDLKRVETHIVSLVLGLGLLILVSFAQNQLLLELNISTPLTEKNFFITFVIYIFTFFLLSLKTIKKSIGLRLSGIPVSFFSHLILSSTLVAASLVGVVLLNAEVTNVVNYFVLIGIIIAVFLIAWKANRLSSTALVLYIFSFSLSVLLMYSMRSNFLVGWDIHQEYRVYQLTDLFQKWSPTNSNSSYNAMLSITLLPASLVALFGLSDLLIFKLVIPILIALCPLLLFSLLRNYLPKDLSFLGAIFFISQFQFMSQLTALLRQGIAYLFFSGLLLVIFGKNFSGKFRIILLTLFAMGSVVSHYSTTYALLVLITSTYLFSKLKSLYYLFFNKSVQQSKPLVSFWFVCFIWLFTAFWYFSFTKIGADLVTVGNKFTQNIDQFLSTELRSEQAQNALGTNSSGYTFLDVNQYAGSIRESNLKIMPWLELYPMQLVSKYPVVTLLSPQIPTESVVIKVTSDRLFNTAKYLVRLFLVIGLIGALFYEYIRNKKIFPSELTFLGVLSLLALLGMATLPIISIYYNFERLYQQLLFILPLFFFTIFLISRQTFIRNIYKSILIAIVLIYFFNSSGLAAQILGGSPSLTLNNFGEEYQRFITYDQERRSVEWANRSLPSLAVINLDRYSIIRFQSSGLNDYAYIADLAPATIHINAYVFLNTDNLKNRFVRANYSEKVIGYKLAYDFFTDQKNLIYSTDKSQLFK